MIQKGKREVVSGTGCSTPVRHSLLPFFRCPSSPTRLTANAQIVAGIISLLNDYRISQGEPALGFLNNWLYGHALDGFNDIESGSNPGCGTTGFPAIKGWDPVGLSGLVSLFSTSADYVTTPRSRVLGHLTSRNC